MIKEDSEVIKLSKPGDNYVLKGHLSKGDQKKVKQNILKISRIQCEIFGKVEIEKRKFVHIPKHKNLNVPENFIRKFSIPEHMIDNVTNSQNKMVLPSIEKKMKSDIIMKSSRNTNDAIKNM